MYHIEITRFDPLPALQKFCLAGAAEAIDVVSDVDCETAVVFVANIRNGIDHGNFYLWLCAGSAYVRLDEHRSRYGSVPDVVMRTSGEANFIDEDGATFSIPHAATMNANLAKDALAHWLTTGRATTALQWS